MSERGGWIVLLVVVLVVMLRGGMALAEDTRVMIVSDVHHLAPSLYQESDGVFLNAIHRGDGKMSQYSGELLRALIEETIHQHPDALIATGDLSFNGELESHQELAAAFAEIEKSGVPVWVIPGNHDINNDKACRYVGKGFITVPNVSAADFGKIYAPYMGEITAAGTNDSYVVQLRDDLWLAMCDASMYEPVAATGGYYSEGHRAWLKGVFEAAKAAGAQVITATHQSVVPHTQFMLESMTVWGFEQMQQDMRESGVCRLNLSGHLHIQHISEENGVWDIATGAYAVPPFRYGMLTISEDGRIQYEANSLCAEHLPEEIFVQSQTWFEEISMEKQRASLEGADLTEEEKEELLTYSARLNHAYFSGELDGRDSRWTQAPGYRLWQKQADTSFSSTYLLGLPLAPENQRDSLHLELP